MIYKVGRFAFQTSYINARPLPVRAVEGGFCTGPDIDIPLVGKRRICGFHIPVFACWGFERGGSSSSRIIAGQPICVRCYRRASVNLCDSHVWKKSNRNQGRFLHLKSSSIVQSVVDTMRAGLALSSGGRRPFRQHRLSMRLPGIAPLCGKGRLHV